MVCYSLKELKAYCLQSLSFSENMMTCWYQLCTNVECMQCNLSNYDIIFILLFLLISIFLAPFSLSQTHSLALSVNSIPHMEDNPHVEDNISSCMEEQTQQDDPSFNKVQLYCHNKPPRLSICTSLYVLLHLSCLYEALNVINTKF